MHPIEGELLRAFPFPREGRTIPPGPTFLLALVVHHSNPAVPRLPLTVFLFPLPASRRPVYNSVDRAATPRKVGPIDRKFCSDSLRG